MQTLGGFAAAVAGFGALLSFDSLRERSRGFLWREQQLAWEPGRSSLPGSSSLPGLPALSCYHGSWDSLAEEPEVSEGRSWCCGGYPQNSTSANVEGHQPLPNPVALLEAVLIAVADGGSGICSDESEAADSFARWTRWMAASLLLASSRSSHSTLMLGLLLLFAALLEFALCGRLAVSLSRWLWSRASMTKQEDPDLTEASVPKIQDIHSFSPHRRPELYRLYSEDELESGEDLSPRLSLQAQAMEELEAAKGELAAVEERIQELENLLQQRAAVADELHQVPEETTLKVAPEDNVPPEDTGMQCAEDLPPILPSPPQPTTESMLTFEQEKGADKQKVLSQELTVAHKQVEETLAENQELRRQLADAQARCAEQKQIFCKQIEEKEAAIQELSADAQQKLTKNAEENGKLRRELQALRKQRSWF